MYVAGQCGPLVTSLGPTHAAVLEFVRTFPPGCDKLVQRMLVVLTADRCTWAAWAQPTHARLL
jgi:hypothetical protein